MNKQVMHHISYGLYILTAQEHGMDNGCIINTAVQVTSSPNRITIAVNKQALTHDMILHTGRFNLSVLSATVPFEVIQHFGMQSGRETAKFATPNALPRSENGLCYIPSDTNAFLSGKVVSSMDLGSHTLFLADVTDGELLSSEASLTYAEYQNHIKPKPQSSAAATGWRCTVCNYEFSGDILPEDFICPICKHGPDAFVRISADATVTR